jgi:hypothetical protein
VVLGDRFAREVGGDGVFGIDGKDGHGSTKHRGVSLATVQKAIKTGRITTTTDGQVFSVQADATWETWMRSGESNVDSAGDFQVRTVTLWTVPSSVRVMVPAVSGRPSSSTAMSGAAQRCTVISYCVER